MNKNDWRACVRRPHEQIQTSNHETIELLGLIRFHDGEFPARDAELRERDLHKQFAALQLFKPGTRGKEWFKPGGVLIDYIREKSETPESLNLPRVIALLNGV